MGVYQDPHLTRGIVKTPKGAILVSCGLDEAADEHRRAAGGESPRRTETGEAPGVPNAAAALEWSGDASLAECSQTFSAGCQALGRQRVGREIESRYSIKWTARG